MSSMNTQYAFDHYSLTDIGNVRTNNEDSYGNIVLPNGQLFIVCDGMGAHQAGEHASSKCVSLIKEFFINNATGNSSIDLHNAIIFANEQLYLTAQNNAEMRGMGTTVVALLIQKDEIYVGHVGDSRIYLLSSGQLIQLTKDHSYVQTLVDQGIIARHEMERHPRKNELTNAIGIYPHVKPTISQTSIQAKQGDTFLLCTDGLNGMISDDEIRSVLKSGNKFDLQSIQLVNQAKIAGGLDNVTVTIIGILKSPFNQTRLNGVDFYASAGTHKNKKSLFSQLWFQLVVAAVIPLLFFMGFGIVSGSIDLFGKNSKKDLGIKPDSALTKDPKIDTPSSRINPKNELENNQNPRNQPSLSKQEKIKLKNEEINRNIELIEKNNEDIKSLKSRGIEDAKTAQTTIKLESKNKDLKNKNKALQDEIKKLQSQNH